MAQIGSALDVFAVHEQVIADYRAFTSGFVEVRDRRIKAFVDDQFAQGVQWPNPWLSLNPSFASGGSVTELVEQGLLHSECGRIFRRKNDLHDLGRDPIMLHRHQREAVEGAKSGRSYVLTTGTGSGKSLAYIVPIVDSVLTKRSQGSAEAKRAALSKLYRYDVRVAPWAGTAQCVLQAVNTYEHHENTVRGSARSDRNMLRTVTGEFGNIDRQSWTTLSSVLDTG